MKIESKKIEVVTWLCHSLSLRQLLKLKAIAIDIRKQDEEPEPEKSSLPVC